MILKSAQVEGRGDPVADRASPSIKFDTYVNERDSYVHRARRDNIVAGTLPSIDASPTWQ